MAAASYEALPLEWNEALSGIFGSISLACWIFLLVPQVYENYVAGSAAGLSLAFLVVWFIGDVANFAGALLAGLVPTVIALAIWYIVADAALLGQVVYYTYIKHRKNRKAAEQNGSTVDDGSNGQPEPTETAPLIRRNSTDVPGSRRRSSALSRHRPSADGLATVQEQPAGSSRRVFKNLLAVIAICAVGTGGWAIAYGVGAWKPTPPPSLHGGSDEHENTVAVVLGYASAVAYLGARIPQIAKNFRDQSCEGLSLLFFVLSMMGNLTYGAQILFHSTERHYVITNLPWLIGSVGTIGEDLVIFLQFRLYRKDSAIVEAADGEAGSE